MMCKIKNILNKIREDSFIRIMIELIILTSMFKISLPISFVLIICIAAEIAFSKKNEDVLCIYLYLSFFDEVLIWDKINGSISRIFMIIIFIKCFTYIIKNRVKPTKYHIGLVTFILISGIIGIYTNGISIELITTVLNIIIFVILSMTIKINDKSEIDIIIEKICYTIVIAVFNSVLYGLITNSFYREIEGKKIVYRFMGTYEPNFMCMYINLAILSLLTVKEKINSKIYYVVFSVLINSAILTVSLTGLGTLSVCILLYLIMNRKNLKEELKNIVIIIIISIIIMGGYNFIKFNIINDQEDVGEETQYINQSIETMDNREYSYSIIENEKNEEENNNDNSAINEINVIENSQEITSEMESSDIDKNKSQIIIRAERIFKLIINGDFDTLTSGRIPLVKTFIKESINRPVLNILLGNGPTVKTLYCSFFEKNCYSHNSYVDCIYNFGIIGFLIIMIYIFRKTKKNMYLNNDITDSKYCNSIKLTRIMLLMYALALTLYTKRMFLTFFIL